MKSLGPPGELITLESKLQMILRHDPQLGITSRSRDCHIQPMLTIANAISGFNFYLDSLSLLFSLLHYLGSTLRSVKINQSTDEEDQRFALDFTVSNVNGNRSLMNHDSDTH